MIYEWKLEGKTRNFGDALYELFLPFDVQGEFESDLKTLYFTVGSVICNEVISESLAQGFFPVFLNCGWRGEELDPLLAAQCEFVGARGPNTQAALARVGVTVEVTLDPAYRLPALLPKGESNGLAICVRHIKDPSPVTIDTIFEYKADAMFSPVIEDREDLAAFVEKISGARFVLAGSLHAAIVAHAYGVPFALLGGDHIDCPAKWEDWLASVNITNIQWVDNVIDGRKWHNTAVKKGAETE